MAFLELNFPPGIRANGTERQERGFWRDGSLVGFRPTLQPIGGWTPHITSTVAGMARAVLPWRDNSGGRWLAIGTHTHLYVIGAATLSDITPTGYTAGRQDATSGDGYGEGNYGVGDYGVPLPDTSGILAATQWDLDTYGQYLIGCTAEDGFLYEWTLNTSTPAAKVTNAPTNLTGCCADTNGFVYAYQDKTVNWSDQQGITTWTPTTTNQAGSVPLNTSGILQCGRNVRGGVLHFTDTDVWFSSYVGLPVVQEFTRVEQNCGAVSKQSPVTFESMAAWMGWQCFWVYNGMTVQALPCDVQDKVFANLNYQQASKVFGVHNSGDGELTWYFPSAASVEIDSYVTWSYRYENWTCGQLARTGGYGQGVFTAPILVDTSGAIWEHETGFNYTGSPVPYPFVTSGPVEIADGEQVMHVLGVVPDELIQGDVRMTFLSRFYPNGPVTTTGPVAVGPGNPSGPTTPLRFMARQTELKLEFTGADNARAGDFRLKIQGRGKR